jgi:hypothetical protein
VVADPTIPAGSWTCRTCGAVEPVDAYRGAFGRFGFCAGCLS